MRLAQPNPTARRGRERGWLAAIAFSFLVFTTTGCGDQAEAEGPPDASMEPVDAPMGPNDGPMNPPPPPVPPGPPSLAAVCGGTSPVTLEDWERCYRKRSCEVQVHCGGAAFFSNVEECIELGDAVSGGQLSFAAAERARALTSGRATLDVPMFTSCLLGLKADQCGTGVRNPACELLFKGTVGNGGACRSDIDCAAPGAACTPGDCGESCCLGSCQPRRKQGEPCIELFECEPGLMCGGQGRCVSGDIGSRCTGVLDCDWNAWCDLSAQVCKEDVPEGEACQNFTQCGGETFCVGLFRPVQPPRCERVTYQGAPCDGDCFGNFYCDMPSSGLGRCMPLPKRGATCSLMVPCVGAGNICSAGICVTRPEVGMPCTEGSCRPGLFCGSPLGGDHSICHEPLPDGAHGCSRPQECASHICSGNVLQPGQCQPYRAVCP